MSTVTFGALEFVKRLRNADVPEKQAEAQAEALRYVPAEQAKVQTQANIRTVENLDSKTEKALLFLEHKIDKRFAEADSKIDLIRKDLTIKMGSMFMIAVGILLAAIKFMS